MRVKILFLFILFSQSISVFAQQATIKGKVTSQGEPIEFVNVYVLGADKGAITDSQGEYLVKGIKPGKYLIKVSYVGYRTIEQRVELKGGDVTTLNFELESASIQGEEIVVTGTLKEITRAKSPVPVELYTPKFFKMNPTPSLYDAMQNVNGVRPQLNCNVCNTGDIHINGLEGPYTMILIDGMPIVSGLSTVYGLSGIPNSMIERIEIVKGPASSLYGSEAVGGLINVITKKPVNAPKFMAEGMATSWNEYNIDLGARFSKKNAFDILTGVNVFNYSNTIDQNNDNFTDVTLQKRASIFQKWSFHRKENRLFSIALRVLYEDRWGGEMGWNKSHRGGDEVYGESIYTKRWEVIGNYQLPTYEKLLFSFSYNSHDQDSYYGDLPYMAQQNIGFGQLTWDTEVDKHSLLVGAALRYTYYDDNTPATADSDNANLNNPDVVWLPGIFIQDDISVNEATNVLLGLRYDYNTVHGNIWTPRFAYKVSLNDKNILRLNAGTGFRVVNLFTEEHASLTGAREVVIEEELKPEQSYNVNLNYEHKIFGSEGFYAGIDGTIWYTYFTNQILPDYESNSNQIVYDNLEGHGVTQGAALNVNLEFENGFKVMGGASFIDVHTVEKNDSGVNRKTRPLLTERWTGTWAVTYPVKSLGLKIDYTGNVYGPMKLPVLNEQDPRPDTSPWWSIQNIQFTWNRSSSPFEVYAGVKNLLNFTPPANSIARSHDPFDKNVTFDGNGEPVATANNPHALTFDPSYVFAPNQGTRMFVGIRYEFR